MSSSASRHPVLDRSLALHARATVLGLTCPDTTFKGWHVEHRFACIRNHVFSTTPNTLLRTLAGCPVCLGMEQLVDLKVRSAMLGVECLEASWLGAGEKFRFRCQFSHEWQQRPHRILCPVCRVAARPRREAEGLRRLQEAAERRGGQCLSETYLGSGMRHRFSCALGHVWEAAAGDILQGGWCRLCSYDRLREQNRLRDGLRKLQEVAEAKGGICLSNTYTGAAARYTFRCANGHVWNPLGHQVLAGRWCRLCATDARRLGIDVAKHEAAKHGGQCLSTTYRNNEGLLFWACKGGHVWRASLKDVRRGMWCRECGKTGRRRAGALRQAAAAAEPFVFFGSRQEAPVADRPAADPAT